MRQNAAEALGRKYPVRRKFSPGRVEIAQRLCFPAFMSVAHALRIAREILRNAFAREALAAEPAPAPPSTPEGPSFGRMLFGIERLPEEPASSTAAPAAPSFAAMLFGAEALPLDPEPTLPPRPLRAPEILAEDPVTPDAPRRGGWLRWIFRPEKLEPHP